MHSTRIFLFMVAIMLAQHSFAQSVLAQGPWYKFSLPTESIYKLTFRDLKEAGIPVEVIDPHTIKIYGNKGGMLPQSNAAPRDWDLMENEISIVGEEDGSFDGEDYILFYGYGPDAISFNEEQSLFNFKKNKYSRFNYYFLTYGSTPGKRIPTNENLGTNFPKVDSYTDGYFLEDGNINLLSSGRMMWSFIDNSKTIALPFTNLLTDGTTKVYVELMAQTLLPSQFTLSLNDIFVDNIGVGSILDYENDTYKYTIRGNEVKRLNIIENSKFSDLQNLKIEFEDKSKKISKAYYKKIIVQTERNLIYEDKILKILTPQTQSMALASFHIEEVTDGLKIWEIEENYRIKDQQFSISNFTAVFGTYGGAVKKFVLFNPEDVPSPDFFGTVENQDLKSYSTPELLIISPTAFLNEANRLASFRRSFDGYSVEVAELPKIYNEFSSGRQDITAIRDFIKFLYEKDPSKLKYVLLLGKGSYEYIINESTNPGYLPVYQSHGSLAPLSTYSSDDYYGFLEEDEGLWPEVDSGDHSLEVGIGRIPATSPEQLKNIVDKLIYYSENPNTLGSWRSKMLFISDDEDDNIHYKNTQDLTAFVEDSLQDFQVEKIYLGTYEQQISAVEERSPDAAKAIMKAIAKEGALLVNYTGHGNEMQWMDEKVFTIDAIDELENKDHLPVFVTATCAFGRHDSPFVISAAEKLLANPKGGGIGIVTTSRPVYSSTNFDLNWALVNAVDELYPENVTLGDIFRLTKNNSLSGVNNRNFILLGDPSLRLTTPENTIALTSITSQDTLKARQELTMSGNVQDYQGQLMNNFDGVVELTVFDKPIAKATKADAFNYPYKFNDFSSIIFKGKATVSNGVFNVKFIIPQDIDPKIDEGMVYLYAYDEANATDASLGAPIKTGGTSNNQVKEDRKGPEIEVFLDDQTFRSGDLIGSNSLLLVHLKDESGINISGRSLGSNIIATIAGQEYILNESYTADQDDFTSGWVSFLLDDMAPGEYTMTLKASDNFTNLNSVTVDFVVVDDSKLIIDELLNFPNPARSFTEFYFTHNRAGDPLEGKLTLLSNRGEKVLEFNFTTEAGQVRHKIMEWDCSSAGHSKIKPGTYYYRLDVRSTLDGAKAEKYQKLIILN